jgi:hypothetical protein
MWGAELGVQNFIEMENFKLGALFTYRLTQNKIRYSATRQEFRGFWQNTAYDLQLKSRYSLDGIPLVFGLSGRLSRDDGWARRPEYDDVLLYENPVDLLSLGSGLTYQIRPMNLLTSIEYVMNDYDITASDYGVGTTRKADIVQNIGRLGLEYGLFDLHSIRAGIEVTDYLVDRWIKLPRNTDRYRVTGGFRYRTGYWDIDTFLEYSTNTKSGSDSERRGLSGIVWFTHSM